MKKNLPIIACIVWLLCMAHTYAAIPAPFPSITALKFTENKGQILDENGKPREDILYTANSRGVQFYITKKGIIYTWSKENKDGQSQQRQVQMELIGANPDAKILAGNRTDGFENYFNSSASTAITHVQSFRKLIYSEIYPHIDFVVYTHTNALKYDFIVRPGGKVQDIRMSYKGSHQVKLQKNGSLLIKNPMGKLIEGKPLTYQHASGDTTEIPSRFSLKQDIISFQVAGYNTSKTLIIDPAIAWATYYGGEKDDVFSIKVDKDGNLYGLGNTRSLNRISQNGYVNTMPTEGERSGLLFKFNAQHQLQWATYFGAECNIGEITFDGTGNLFIAGTMDSDGLVPVNNILTAGPTGGQNIFVTKMNAEGVPQWTTFFGGSNNDIISGMVRDQNGNLYIAGYTNSSDGIATTGAYQPTPYNPACSGTACNDAFLAKFTPDGLLQWGTYYGGTGRDESKGLAIDSKSNLYIYGRAGDGISHSTDVIQPGYNGGGVDGFIAKFSTEGNRLWGTYFGGNAWDILESLTIDENDNLYLTGETQSNNLFAGKSGTNPSYKASWDDDDDSKLEVFIAKINTSGKVQWSTYFGGKRRDSGQSIFYNGKGRIYVVGFTNSETRTEPKAITSGSHVFEYGLNSEHSNKAKEDVFITRFDTAGTKIWGTYFGGVNNESAFSMDVAPDGKLYITGRTESDISMPATASYSTRGGGYDGFIIALDDKDPVITEISPVHQSEGVPVTTTLLEITFDEPIVKGTGNILIKQGTQVVKTIPIENNAISITDKKVSINLSLVDFTFILGSTYQVQVDATGFKNTIGNRFKGISSTEWQFTVVPDEVAPQLATIRPAHTGSNIAYNANLELEFNESVVAGTGSITIYKNGVPETIPATDESVTINGNIVTINLPVDFAFGGQVSVEVDNLAFKDGAGNFFGGIGTGNWQFTIQDIEITPAEFLPLEISYNGTTIDPVNAPTQTIQVRPNVAGTTVALYTRGSSSSDTDWVKHLVEATEDNYTIFLPTDSIYKHNKMGLEYYFEVIPPAGYGSALKSDTGMVYITHDTGISIPLQHGSSQTDYRLFSIPLTLDEKAVSSVFYDLGPYNIEKWRLYRYENDGTSAGYQEYAVVNEFTHLELGRAYWILAREGTDFSSGKGSTLPVSQAKPYVMSLKPGWNLIGNPYDMHVSWAEVQATNEGLGELFVYAGKGEQYDSGDLMRYSGGFVHTTEAKNINIPLLRNKPLNGGRLSAEKPKYHASSLFEVNFTLQGKEMYYRLAGLGMHPEASTAADKYDRYVLPRFADFLDIKFASQQDNSSAFTKHMVEVEEDYTWDFTVETNLPAQVMDLTWENYFSQPTGKQLYLYDVKQEKIVNMLEQHHYMFDSKQSGLFKVYYGSQAYLAKHLKPQQIRLNQNVPNPFSTQTLIPFTLPDGKATYPVEMNVYTLTGKQVASIVKGNFAAGFHEIKWDGKDTAGNKLPSGLYICRMIVEEERKSKILFIRLIVN